MTTKQRQVRCTRLLALRRLLILTLFAPLFASCSGFEFQESEQRRCVPLDHLSRMRLAGVLGKFCPSISASYLNSSGVVLRVGPAGNTNFTADQIIELVKNNVDGILTSVGDEIGYFNQNKERLIEVLQRLHWKPLPKDDVTRHLDLMLCTTLFPMCTYRSIDVAPFASSRAQQEHTVAGMTATPQPVLRHLPTCDWICNDLRVLLREVIVLSTDSQRLRQTKLHGMISAVVLSCGNATSLQGHYVHCLNFSKTSSGSVVEDLYPPLHSAGNKVDTGDPSLEVMTNLSRTFSPPSLLCLNLSGTACGHGFVATPIESHWNADVQESLKMMTAAARGLLNVSHDIIPFNGSLQPCAIGCKSILFTDDEIKLVHDVFLPSLQVTFFATFFALVSFLIQWERMRKYPIIVLFYLNLSSLLSSVAFSLTFYRPGGSKSFICHSDGSLLTMQPRMNDEASWCIVQYIFCYFFLVAAGNWWACFAHSWFRTFSDLKRRKDSARSNSTSRVNIRIMIVYHIVAWVPPLLLLIPVMVDKQIIGTPIYGICWLNSGTHYLVLFVLPQGIAMVTGSVFMLLGLRALWKARRTITRSWSKGQAVSRRKSEKRVLANADRYLIQMPIFLCAGLLFVIAQVSLAIYETVNSEKWKDQVRSRSRCLQLTCGDVVNCPPAPRGNAYIFLCKILVICVFGCLTCSWAVLSRETWRAWAHVLHIRRRQPQQQNTHSQKQALSMRLSLGSGSASYTENSNHTAKATLSPPIDERSLTSTLPANA